MDEIIWAGRFGYRVKGVAEDLPTNSHLLAGMLAAMVGAMATLLHAIGALKTNPVNSLRAE